MSTNNPLKFIAVFGTVVGSLAIVSLIFLPPAIQSIFVYFAIGFPVIVLLLFLVVLYFPNGVFKSGVGD